MVHRVVVTPAGETVIVKLAAFEGTLLFHTSDGCCDGSSRMFYPVHEFRVDAQDIPMGSIAASPFYIGAARFEYRVLTQRTIDGVSGRGFRFSLEHPEGLRFLTRRHVFDDAEAPSLRNAGPPARGDEPAGHPITS